MHHPRTVLALVLTGTLLLGAGCSDEGAEADPQPILPSSSSASPTDEPTPSASPTEAPTMPAAAEELTRDGAAEFARHWVALFNYAQRTGDTSPLLEVSDPRCVSCSDARDAINEVYESGGSVDGNGWRVRQAGYDPLTPIEGPLISTSIRQTPEKVVYRDPRRVEQTQGSVFTVLFRVNRAGSGWVMREVEVR